MTDQSTLAQWILHPNSDLKTIENWPVKASFLQLVRVSQKQLD